jgi:hypothetical protein
VCAQLKAEQTLSIVVFVFGKVRSASFHLHKRFLKSFGRSVEIWYDFPNVAILVSLGCWKLAVFNAVRLRITNIAESSAR